MKLIGKEFSFLLAGLLALTVMSCKDDQVDQAPEPVIKSALIQYSAANTSSAPEGIIKLSFQFHDVDNDLGFDWNGFTSGSINYFLNDGNGLMMPVSYSDTLLGDHSFPVHLLNVPASSVGKLVTIRTKMQFRARDNFLARAAYPYGVSHLLIRSQNQSIICDDQKPTEVILSGQTFYAVSDTLYWQENPATWNLAVQFLEVKANNVVEEYNWMETHGVNFNTRIPDVTGLEFGKRIQTGGVVVTGFSTTDGLIEYGMRSADFGKVFSGKKIRLRITVSDKAHHLSNIIESNDLQF